MNVRDVMTPLIESVGPDDTLRDASEKMNALDLRPLPVTENGKLVGVLTEDAIRAEAAHAGLATGSVPVRQIMSMETVCVREDVSLHDALAELGDGGQAETLSRIPVVDAEGALVGSVTAHTLRSRLQSEEAPDAGEAAVYAVESVSSLVDYSDDSLDYMSDESFPASDPMPSPGSLGPEEDEDR